MIWANVVLDYVKVLAWPLVVLCGMWLFRRQLRALILNAKTVSAFGAQAEFSVNEQSLQQTELQVSRSLEIQRPEGTTAIIESHSIVQRIESIVSIDPISLDSKDPADAALYSFERLKEGVSEALHYFGVPASSVDGVSAGVIMTRITGLEPWEELLDLFAEKEELMIDAQRFLRLRKGRLSRLLLSREVKAKFEMGSRRQSGHFFRMSRILITLTAASVKAQLQKEKESQAKLHAAENGGQMNLLSQTSSESI